MSSLARKQQEVAHAQAAAPKSLIPYIDPFEHRVLPQSGYPFWTQNKIINGNLRQFPYHLSQMDWILSRVQAEIDLYMSQAFFKRPCRQAIHLMWLTHAWVDLDIYRLEEPRVPGTEGMAIRLFCRDQGIPEPSLIISSGRGVYCKWLWDSPVPRAALGRAVAVNKALVRRFADWEADPQSTDVSRILRVPGSVNSKNGETVRIIYIAELDGAPLTYNFDEFANNVLPYTLQQVREFREAAKLKGELHILDQERARREAHERSEKVRVGTPTAFCAEDWHWGILEDVRTWANLKFEGGIIPEGMRDLVGHIGACQLAMVIPSHRLWHEIQAWSRILLPADYRETAEFRNHCSTLLQYAQRATRGEFDTWKGKKVTPIYTYRASTLIDLLGITSDDMKHMTRLIDRDEKRRRDREAWRGTHTGLSREEYLEENTISREKPWEVEGISRCHWYRNQKQQTR